jgi:hypothetical protein
MTLTRIGLLVMALAFATSPACKDRSPERQAATGPAQAPSPAADLHAREEARAPRAAGTARAPLAIGTEPAEAPIVNEVDEAPPGSDAVIQLTEALPHARQHALTEADMRRAIEQLQARMNDELARARGIIVELQRANAELRQALAAERLQLAELHKRLTSGRSIALQ